jgi:hypothetical protein
VCVEGEQRAMEDARPGRGLVERARRMEVRAVGVNGGVMRRRESLVVWALIKDAESWARERGFIVLSLGVLLMLLADSLLDLRSVGAGVDWSCVSRLEMLDTVDFNAARSCSTLLGDPGIVGAVVVLY